MRVKIPLVYNELHMAWSPLMQNNIFLSRFTYLISEPTKRQINIHRFGHGWLKMLKLEMKYMKMLIYILIQFSIV
jgi:hypothetical protein